MFLFEWISIPAYFIIILIIFFIQNKRGLLVRPWLPKLQTSQIISNSYKKLRSWLFLLKTFQNVKYIINFGDFFCKFMVVSSFESKSPKSLREFWLEFFEVLVNFCVLTRTWWIDGPLEGAGWHHHHHLNNVLT